MNMKKWLCIVCGLCLILSLTACGSDENAVFVQSVKTLSGLGGIIGVASGIGLAQLISWMMQIPVAIDVGAIAISVVFSMLIGVIFGLLPAVKAANLNPIEALRRV